MRLSTEIIEAELSVLNSIYRPPKTEEEIKSLSLVYYADCIHMSAEEFENAVSMHRKTSNFFPTPHEVIEQCRKITAERRANLKHLPPPPMLSEKQRKYNLKRIQDIKRRMKIRVVPKIKKGERFADLSTPHADKVRSQAKAIQKGGLK